MTNYNVTELNNNTACYINVTASNNAGSSDSTNMLHITNTGKFIILYAFVTEFVKRGLIHTSNFSTLRRCNSACG